MAIRGRFARIDKARDKRRVSRIPVSVNSQTIDGLNRAVERAVRANLSGGITTFRQDVAKMQLDAAFNAKDYAALRKTTAWAKAEGALGKAAARLSGVVPQTQSEVMRGVVGGVGGAAATDPTFTQPINFDEAFGRKPARVRVPAPAADPLERRIDATNPRLAPHTLERRQKYLTDLFMPQREDMQRIAVQAGKTMRQRADDIKGVLRPEVDDIVGQRLAMHIGLNREQSRSLFMAEENDRKAGVPEDQIDRNLKAKSDKMLDTRAMTVAVTEARAASGRAQIEAWLAMQEQGLIGPNAMAVWHVAWEEACPNICKPVDGVRVALGEAWTMGNGSKCDAPGTAHPRCRCLASLYDPDVDDDDTGRNADAFVPEGYFDDG
jgi:hypothetical protein